MKIRILLFLSVWFAVLGVKAADFTTLIWKSDTTQLGITFSGASYEPESGLPYYSYQFDLGENYALRSYSVSVDYPEYQYIPIPKGAEEWVKKLPYEPVVETGLQVSSHRGFLQTGFVPLVYRDGKLMRINSFRLVLDEVSNTRALRGTVLTAEAPVLSDYAVNSRLATGKWIKISVPNTGVFKLTDSKLREIGFSDPAKVHCYGYGGALLAENLKGDRADDLCEVPLWKVNGGVLFYAQGPVSWKANSSNTYFSRIQNFYAKAGYYFLTEESTAPDAFQVMNTTGNPVATVTTFSNRALYEDDAFNWTASGRELYEGYDYVNGNRKSYPFSLQGITGSQAYCTVEFAAKHTSSTTVNIDINGSSVGNFTLFGVSESDAYTKAQVTNYTSSNWKSNYSDQTTVTLTHTRPSGANGRLNYIALNYRSVLKMYGSSTSFRDLSTVGKGVVRYSLSDCNSNTVVWDVTTPGEYAQVQGSLSGSVYSFLGNNASLREYVAVDVNGSFPEPTVVGAISNQDLHSLEQPDMVIIIPTSARFQDQAERLAEAHRKKDDMVVHVVRADQIYNEFSSGTPDATAYRWFMKMFYDRGKGGKLPSYLLLMGDCSYDNRMLTSIWNKYNPNDFLLCYQSMNSTSETSSFVTDDYLGMLDLGEGGNSTLGNDMMDIGVGRFPVRSWDEAKIAVDKTIAYMENKETGPWKNKVCYAADDEERQKNNTFMIGAEVMSSYTEKNHPQFMVNRIYQDAFPRESTASGFTYKQATKRLLSSVNEGLLLLNYTGHGGPSGWSAEFLLTIQQIRAMRNSRLALWVTATCDFCRYDDMTYSAGEEAFLNSRGGAVALFTTSRVVYGIYNDALNKKFNENIFNLVNGKRLRLGDIMRLSKKGLNETNKLNFSLIGDPALMLGFPDHKVIVDSFNGQPATASGLKLRAGDVVTIKGHIEDSSGEINRDFNGLVYPTVFDEKEHVVCNNHVEAEKAFEYDQRNNKLFAGSDSVRAGYFEVTFPVPLDISYSNNSGIINLYAASETGVEGQGYFENFVVGGTAPDALETDSLGPKIWLYLNNPDFQAGGVVNSTPYLYAEITDEEGINATGNSIGHDIMVSIDNSPLYTYVLNEYFQLASGTYSKGMVRYQFESLPEGEHTLYFTAWDTKNNSSVYQLPFQVSSAAAPAVNRLSCYPVPAVNDLTFYFEHNRPGADLTVTFEVFTFSGAPVWNYTLTDLASDQYYTYTWDLTTDGGARLPQGVYLYRARVSTPGSEETTETLKFVVTAQ